MYFFHLDQSNALHQLKCKVDYTFKTECWLLEHDFTLKIINNGCSETDRKRYASKVVNYSQQ